MSKLKKILAVSGVIMAALVPCACAGEPQHIVGGNGGETDQPDNVHVCKYVEEIIAPTCEQSGYTYYYCSCGKNYKDHTVNNAAALGHSWSEYEFNDDATCTKYGTETKECSRCHTKITQTADTKPKKPHSYSPEAYTTNDDATCTANGTETAKCANCDATDTREIPNSKKQHSYVEYFCEECYGMEPDAPFTSGLKYEPVRKDNNTFGEIIGYNVSGAGNATGEVAVPNYYEGKPVVRVWYDAFKNASRITKITLPDTVTEIADNAFDNCEYLQEIVMPAVKKIGNYAFKWCTRLKNVVIPDCAETIGDKLFSGCSALESITLPFLGETADDTADATLRRFFEYNAVAYAPASLKKITLTKVTALESGAFIGAQNLECIALPETLASIASSSLSYCANLATIEFGGTEEQWNAVQKSSGWDKTLAEGYKVTFKEE